MNECTKYYCHSRWGTKDTFFEVAVPTLDSNLIYGRIYVALHLMSHKENERKKVVLDSIPSRVDTPLLVDNVSEEMVEDDGKDENKRIIKKHYDHDTQCIQYQYRYFKSIQSKSGKRAYLKQFKYKSITSRIGKYVGIEQKWKLCVFWCLFGLYVVARLVMSCGLPYYWFFYIYLYEMNGWGFCGDWDVECIENVLVVVLMAILTVFTVMFGWEMIYLLRCEYWFGYLLEYTWKAPDYRHFKDLQASMVRNKIILENVQHDIAVIICTYLGKATAVNLGGHLAKGTDYQYWTKGSSF